MKLFRDKISAPEAIKVFTVAILSSEMWRDEQEVGHVIFSIETETIESLYKILTHDVITLSAYPPKRISLIDVPYIPERYFGNTFWKYVDSDRNIHNLGYPDSTHDFIIGDLFENEFRFPNPAPGTYDIRDHKTLNLIYTGSE